MKFTDQFFADAQKVIMDVLQKARPELLKHYGKIAFDTKDDRSIVTHLDKELELKLKAALQAFDNGIGIWGEEYGQEGNKDTFWLIDPIDGTEFFVRGLPACRNMVTLVHDGQPLFAVVYRFVSDELFVAAKGKGATKDGQPIHVSNRPLYRAWIDWSVNIMDPSGYKLFRSISPHIAGYTLKRDFLEVAEGFVEGMVVYKSDGDVWDYAPRALIFAEAGARVTNIGSSSYDFRDNNFVAASPLIFDELHKLLSLEA